MKHTIDFYKTKYEEYQQQARVMGLENVYTSLRHFQTHYDFISEGIKQKTIKRNGTMVETILYRQQFPTSYQEARAFRKLYEKHTGQKITIKELQKMSWEERVQGNSGIQGALKDAYKAYRAEGHSAKESKAFISHMYFGSE